MTTLLTLATVLFAFIFGFFLGQQTSTKKDDTPTFSDPDFADEAGEKGRKSIQARIERRKSRILARAKEKQRITNDDVEDLFCISDTTARRYLGELEAEGKLIQHGESGRDVYYTPAL